MRLLLDIGNSSVRYTLCEDHIGAVYTIWHHGAAPDLQVWSDFKPTAVYAACVAPPVVRQAISEWVAAQWQLTVQYITVDPARLAPAYANPSQFGVDRWLALLAARAEATPVAVLDCGTCLTLDVLDARGQHCGGHILPGPWLMHQAIADHTAIPAMAPVWSEASLDLARSTEAGISAGILQAVTAYLNEQLQRLAADYSDLRCWLTGGDAAWLQSHVPTQVTVHPHLVLQGLALVTSAS